MAAENFEQPAILRLRQPAAATFFGHAGAEHSESAEAIDHALGNHRLAVDRHRIDFRLAEAPQFRGQFGGRLVGRQIGIGEQLLVRKRAEV